MPTKIFKWLILALVYLLVSSIIPAVIAWLFEDDLDAELIASLIILIIAITSIPILLGIKYVWRRWTGGNTHNLID